MAVGSAHAQVAATPARTTASNSFEISVDGHAARVSLSAADTVHVQMLVNGEAPPTTLVIDPTRKPAAVVGTHMRESAGVVHLDAPAIRISWNRHRHELAVANPGGEVLLHTTDLASLAEGHLNIGHGADQPMYGIGGYGAFTKDVSAGMLRKGKQVVESGEQGWMGAPLVWSTAGYGVLTDMETGSMDLQASTLAIRNASRQPMDVYIVVGKPAAIFAAVAAISGRTPLFPKWAMGFTNSQWGIDEKQLLDIVDTYRAKHIPIDNFTLDFDWKAWGEDNDGEFRWNPKNFPDGPTGKLKSILDGRGVQITGIMKPRIHVNTVEGRYATEHHFWVPGEKVSDDYFSHKPVKNVDFDIPAARSWFGDLAVKYGFDKGIVGWWNDEADTTGSNTEFLNMQRGIYNAQRKVSNERVWSINRNFFLGSQRYAYGAWSGDIDTGFVSMADQRARLLSAINVGAMQWGMDGGGFKNGTPTPENYTRWIQFGAFTPIFRVHGDFGQKRQPWTFGPVAEKAATAAIRLRYSLIPYIYSYEYQRRTTGVGLVTPLTFDWPNDPKVRNDVSSWMFGEGLLVSPVVQQGATSKQIYLPEGTWTNWFSGKVYQGGQTLKIAVDSKNWSDIPLYVRQGAIIPMQPPMDYVGEKPLTEVTLSMFPDARRTQFEYYDDDGRTYDYEKGESFRQSFTLQRSAGEVKVQLGEPEGGFKPQTRFFLLAVHGEAASTIKDGGNSLPHVGSRKALDSSDGEGWTTGEDRFGAVTWVRVAAAKPRTLVLTAGQRRM